MILIAGPCVLESRDNVMRIAESLGKYHDDCTKEFYFKASFDKANRTSLDSFRGPGLDEGLKMLQEVKDQFPCIFMSPNGPACGSCKNFCSCEYQKRTVLGTCCDGTLCS